MSDTTTTIKSLAKRLTAAIGSETSRMNELMASIPRFSNMKVECHVFDRVRAVMQERMTEIREHASVIRSLLKEGDMEVATNEIELLEMEIGKPLYENLGRKAMFERFAGLKL